MTPTDFENHNLFEKLEQLSLKIKEEELRKLIGIDELIFFDTPLATCYFTTCSFNS